MAAQSAAEVLEQPAVVVEARTIPQGLTSLLAFDEKQVDRRKLRTHERFTGRCLFQVV